MRPALCTVLVLAGVAGSLAAVGCGSSSGGAATTATAPAASAAGGASAFDAKVGSLISAIEESAGSPAGISDVGEVTPVITLVDRAAATVQRTAPPSEAAYAATVSRTLAALQRDLVSLRRAVASHDESARLTAANRAQADLQTLAGLARSSPR